jgi:outer membrane lipoprotein carrier protein
MKIIFGTLLSASLALASLDSIHSFHADFSQAVTDDKNTTIQYSGKIWAQKPQEALWRYITPIQKDVYINEFNMTIVEPEIEQVIIKNIQAKIDFFQMIKNAKKIDPTRYEAYYNNVRFMIEMNEKVIQSISYQDDFDNTVIISFTKQKQNTKIDKEIFEAKYPLDFDVIRD